MPCPDYAVLEKSLTFTTQAENQGGIAVDTDSLPTYKVYEDETGTEIASGTMAKLDDANTTGFYSEQLSTTSANGYEHLKTYNIRVTTAIAGTSIVAVFPFICLGDGDVTVNTGDQLTTTARFKSYAGITSSDDDTLIGLLVARATNAIQVHCNRDFVVTTYREFYDGDGQNELILSNFPVISVSMLGVGRQDAFTIQNSSSDSYHAQVSISSTGMQLQVQGGDNEDDTTLTLADYATLTLLFAAITALDKGWTILQTADLVVWAAAELLPTGKGLQCLDDYASPQLPNDPENDFTTDTKAGILKYFGRFNKGFSNIVVRYSAGYASIPADLEQICIDLVKTYWDNRKVNTSLESERFGDYSYKTKADKPSTGSKIIGIPPTIAGRLSSWRTNV